MTREEMNGAIYSFALVADFFFPLEAAGFFLVAAVFLAALFLMVFFTVFFFDDVAFLTVFFFVGAAFFLVGLVEDEDFVSFFLCSAESLYEFLFWMNSPLATPVLRAAR